MAFTVSLNGNNYISDKRKNAFEKAIEDDNKMKPGGNGQKPLDPETRRYVDARCTSISSDNTSFSATATHARLFQDV